MTFIYNIIYTEVTYLTLCSTIADWNRLL